MTTDPDSSPRVVGLGLQLERTALAWRRTALSVGVAAVGGARLLVELDAEGAAAVATVVGVGLAAAALVCWLAARRYAAGWRALVDNPPGSAGEAPALPGAFPLAVVAATQVVAGLAVAVMLVM